MTKTTIVDLVCPRCYAAFTCLANEYDPDKAICEHCGTRLMKVD